MARILIIGSDGMAIDHFDYCYFRMLEERFDVTIAAPQKRPLRTSLHLGGPDTHAFYIERRGYILPAHASFTDVDPAEFDGLLIPGGRAPEYLRNDERCLNLVRHFIKNDKPISCLCHGPLLILAAGVRGRRMTCSDDIAIDVATFKNTYVEAKGEQPGEPDHVVDGNLVTARGWWHWNSWIREFLVLLEQRGIARPNRRPTTNQSPPSRVLILSGEHASFGSLAYGYERLYEAGHHVTLAAPDNGWVKTIVDPREEGWDFQATSSPYEYETPGIPFPGDALLDEIEPANFDALLIPGGRAPEYLRQMSSTQRIVRHFLETNKPIGSICQGVRILVAAGLTGRRLTGADMTRTEVCQDNTYVRANDEAVIDGNIVTVSGRPYYHVWMREFIRRLA